MSLVLSFEGLRNEGNATTLSLWEPVLRIGKIADGKAESVLQTDYRASTHRTIQPGQIEPPQIQWEVRWLTRHLLPPLYGEGDFLMSPAGSIMRQPRSSEIMNHVKEPWRFARQKAYIINLTVCQTSW